MDVAIEDVVRRLDDERYVVLDVRSGSEFTGERRRPATPAQDGYPGARHFDVQELLPSRPSRSANASARRRRWSWSPTATPGPRSELAAEISALLGYSAFELPRLVARVVAGRVAARGAGVPRP